MELVDADKKILEYVKKRGMASPQEVAIALGEYSINYIRTRMSLLEKAGLLKRVSRGLYAPGGENER